jgi:hypothetical protein
MKPQDEIKKDSRLQFIVNPKSRTDKNMGIHSGYITLSNGRKGTFAQGRDEAGMEHVSVQLRGVLPRWSEMCEVKDIFWENEEMVVQIHPKKSEYVNITEALHLWRPKDGDWGWLNDKGAEE